MLPIERVKAALNFENPDKVPVFHGLGGDIVISFITCAKGWKPGHKDIERGLFPHGLNPYSWERPAWAQNNPEYEGNHWKRIPHEEVDELGCIWNMKGNDIDIGHPGRPSLPDLGKLENYLDQYKLDAKDKTRYEVAIKMKKSYEKEKYHLVHLYGHGPNQSISYMRGFSNYLIDHRKHPKELKKLLTHVVDFHVDTIKTAFELGLEPDGFWLLDDLGEQNGPFFSPETFKEFHAPGYRKIIEAAHDLGADVHLHCCGKIDELLPILIDCGLDAIELDSPRMTGYPDLAPLRGKIMFWGCVNIQSIYTQGTPEEVEREVWHMIRNLGTKKGGYGAYFYDEVKTIKVPRKNIKAFVRGLQKYGDYSKIPNHWWDYPVQEKWDYSTVPDLPPIEL
jgi:uroporphyrinogen decarboxylase